MIAHDRRVALTLFLLAFVTYGWFFSGGGWNQNANFDLTRALVERQTLHIDGYHANTGDISVVRHGDVAHAYNNKPPGVSFLAAIPYAALYAIERMFDAPTDSTALLTLNAWLVTAATCGLTGALIPVVLFWYGRRRVSPLAAAGVALIIAFGTIVFPYSTLLYAHVPPALFLLLAFVWLDERPLLAGAAAGIAGVSFYLCILAAVVLFVAALVRGGWKPALRFALGGLPFAILLTLYQYACFGSPFVTSVEVSKEFTEQGLLFGVFRAPSLEALWGLTFSEYRGLFVISPVLLLAFVGAVVQFIPREDAGSLAAPRRRRLWHVLRGMTGDPASTRGINSTAIIAAIALIFLLAVSSFNGWAGGSAIGPRYLLPIIPLMGIPLLYLRGRWLWSIACILGLASFAMQFLATAVDPMPIGTITRPMRGYVLPAFKTGRVAPHIAHALGFRDNVVGHVSINANAIDEAYPHHRHPPGSGESEWASFNLGELLSGPGERASVVPIALWVLIGSAFVLRRSATDQRTMRRTSGGTTQL